MTVSSEESLYIRACEGDGNQHSDMKYGFRMVSRVALGDGTRRDKEQIEREDEVQGIDDRVVAFMCRK